MVAFALSIFTGAFLVFQVQPLIAKYILPWFGGGAGVWTTCMLFFQVLLLGGYAYAHVLSRVRSPRVQASIHMAVLAGALAFLPIVPDPGWKPEGTGDPAWRILILLLVTVGVPGLVVSSTGPLVQRWFHDVKPDSSPYRLYALSNLGSLLALLSYPVFFEPNLSRHAQALVWSFGFAAYALLSVRCAARLWRVDPSRSGTDAGATTDGPPALPPTGIDRALWFLLPACGTILLLSFTNQICVDVAVVPFLWIFPLSVYLLTFILAFHAPRWYPRPLFAALLVPSVAGVAFVLRQSAHSSPAISLQLAVYGAALFVTCMVCHGELVRRRPDPGRLTSFYLIIAAGGAGGGAFTALAAPIVFRSYAEIHVGLLGCCLLALVAFFTDRRWILGGGKPRWAWSLLLLVLGGLAWGLWDADRAIHEDAVLLDRGFYGTLKVTEEGREGSEMFRRVLTHGTTVHGLQFADPEKRRWPTSYFGPESGVGRAIGVLQRAGAIRIGIVGLGVGTISAYGREGDVVRFYELNPHVERVARAQFRYLADSRASVEVVLGDARISMEREEPQAYDLLVLDAFSSDAVPVHLLTREAFEIYRRHVKADGVIALHISNAYLDLEPVVNRLADHFGLKTVFIEDYRTHQSEKNAALAREDRSRGLMSSDWMLLSRNAAFLDSESIQEAAAESDPDDPEIPLWTDDRTSLFPILKR